MAGARYPLLDKVVLITGAASGIGAETARQVVRRGAKVALLGLQAEQLRAVADELGADNAGAWEVDVTDWDALQAAVDGAAERFGGIDVVIANAGVGTWGTVETQDRDEWERTIEVNLLGVWRTVRTALPHVLERDGYVLNVASLSAVLQAPLMSAYSASKAGVENFSNCLRLELASTGTDVGCAYFGFLHTDMVHAVEEDPDARSLLDASGPIAPLEPAIKTLVRGIEARKRKVYYPKFILPALIAPAPLQRIAELQMRRDDMQATIRRINERARTAARDRVGR